MVGKRILMQLAFCFAVAIFSLSLVNAVEIANFTQITQFSNIGVNTTINITIGAVSNNNITKVVFSWAGNAGTQGEVFVMGSNGTTGNATFTNNSVLSGSSNHNVSLNFTNASTALIPNGTTRTFWFDVRSRSIESIVNITVNVTNETGETNSTTFSFHPAFAFEGYVRNETGCTTCFQAYANATIYGTVPNPNGPRTTRALASTISNASGYFRLANVNITAGGFDGYQLKFFYYNNSNATFSAANDTALKTGAILPEFPRFMYYMPQMSDEGGDMGFDMTLNKGTFYLQPAVTIRVLAHNGTTPVSFGYELVDQTLGFPIESNIMGKTGSANITVPAGRGYTVSIFRFFGFPGSTTGFISNPAFCNSTSDLMNDTHCPAPPKSAAVSVAQAIAGTVVTVNQSLVVRKAQVSGCINVAAGTNNTALNVTRISVKMLPWTTDVGSFVPPANGDDGTINLTRDINYTTNGCSLAWYNISLLNSTGYMIEFYAKNATNESGNPGNAWNLAAFLNLTSSRDNGEQINVSAYRLAGTYRQDNVTGALNTSMIKINTVNSSGGAVTTNINANLKIRNTVSGIGNVYYIIDSRSISNGSFYIPVLNNSRYAKVMIFSQNGPPRESTINLSASEVNITVTSIGMDKGFRKFRGNGSLESMNVTSSPVQMRFLRTDDECDLPNSPSSCEITSFNATGFNPLKALMAGKVNMEIKITSTNVTIIYHDYDMMSAKQPPMDSIMSENATDRATTAGSTSMQETWNFGSFAPVDSYKNVTIVIPYSDTTTAATYLNDTAPVNLSIPLLYDENSQVIYNRSRGDTLLNLSDDFIEYNTSEFDDFVNATGGYVCNITNATAPAYINQTGNYISFKIPHFSTIGATVSGTATLTAAAAAGSSSSPGGSSGGGGTTANTTNVEVWTVTFAYDDQELSQKGSVTRTLRAKERIRLKVEGKQHHVGISALTSTGATISVASTPQQATIAIGESRSFELTGDGYYDVKVTLVSITGSLAQIKILPIHEAVPVPVNNTTEGPTTGGVEAGSDTSKGATATGEGSSSPTQSRSKTIWLGIVIVLIIAIVIFFGYRKMSDLQERVHVGQHSKSIKVH